MRIEYLFFIICLALGFWLIPKSSFIRKTDLTKRESSILLALKILSGVVCAVYFERFPTHMDYIGYNMEGKIQYELLLSKPTLFFTDFSNDIHTYGLGGLLASKDSFWAYLRFNLVFKFIGLLNLVTHGNFYFNTVLFSGLVFFGHIAFYRIFSEIYKGHKRIILFAIFCLPSLLLYTSCIHKDGIVFLGLGLVSYTMYRILTSSRNFNFKYAGGLFLGMATIFLFRNYVIVALVPAMLTALFCKMLPYKKRFIILTAYSFFFLLFFLSGFSKSFLNLPAAVIQRKADFTALGDGNTTIPMNELKSTLGSFMINLPQAINHSLFRPYLWEFPQPSVFLTALELFIYQLLLLAFIFYRKKTAKLPHPFNIFGLALMLNMMLIIGYTIPNMGAIVRYRSIFWVLLICPLAGNTDWRRLLSFWKKSP